MDSYDPRVFSCPGTIPTNLLSQAGLQPSQALPARFKFLVTRTNLKPIVEALLFLRKSCVGRIGALKLKVAENTVSARADDLCHFYQYLDSEGLPLEDIEPEDLFNYVGSMYGMVSPTTNKIYAKATIIRRLSTIRPFILFCQNQGWLKNRFEVETRVVDGKAREILEPDLVYELIEPADRRVKHIPANDLQYLMDALGCWTELGEQAPAAGPRNRLIGEVALQSGLRRTEITSLKSRHFQDVTLEGRSDFSTITVPVLGKGNKWRDVPFPVWLAKAIQRYIASERKDAIEKRKKTEPSFVDHGRVFVQADNEKGTPGDPIKPKQINRIFQTARSAAAGAGTTCAAKSARFRTYTFHGLRHTFALVTYAARRAAGDHNPGRYVQAVLGHARQETTDRLYLQASLLHEAELSDYVQGFLLEMAVMHA